MSGENKIAVYNYRGKKLDGPVFNKSRAALELQLRDRFIGLIARNAARPMVGIVAAAFVQGVVFGSQSKKEVADDD